MTTTVTIKTHDWPVAVVTNDHYETKQSNYQQWSNGQTVEFVEANSSKDFYITQSRNITFYELAKGATDLTGFNYGLSQPQSLTTTDAEDTSNG